VISSHFLLSLSFWGGGVLLCDVCGGSGGNKDAKTHVTAAAAA